MATIHVMADSAGSGVYDFREVEELLHISPEMLARVALPEHKGRRPALVRPAHHSYFTFREFVSVAVVVTLRKRGVSYDDIASAAARLGEQYRTPWPFAHREALAELRTSGRDLLLGPDMETPRGQRVLQPVAEIYLRHLAFEDGHAARWTPVEGIVLDPKIQAGAPCLAGTRVPTAVVVDLIDQGADPEDVADELDLETRQVVAALRFQKRVEHGQLAA